MSALELYAKQVIGAKGTEHMAALEALRSYMRLTHEEDIIRYINMITDPEILRALIEAGMRGTTHRATISRLNMLMKEQQEAKK
jgi:hypothetical protein